MNPKTKTIGILLAGCGHQDGAEIREAVFTILAVDKCIATESQYQNFQVVLMAPNREQYHVINHLTGKEQEGTLKRNILQEAARIARGQIRSLEEVNPQTLDALLMPGGYGAAKNYCNFAFKGAHGHVESDVLKLLTTLFERKCPIGAICISPAVLSLALGKHGIGVSIGNDPQTAEEITKTGAHHFSTQVEDCYVDEKNKIVSTPAYMYGQARPFEIYQGIEKCVQRVLQFLV